MKLKIILSLFGMSYISFSAVGQNLGREWGVTAFTQDPPVHISLDSFKMTQTTVKGKKCDVYRYGKGAPLVSGIATIFTDSLTINKEVFYFMGIARSVKNKDILTTTVIAL